MYRRYYSYNDMPRIAPKGECEIETRETLPAKPAPKKALQTDDIILGIIILAILLDDANDNLLLLALAAIFLAGG